MAGLVRLGVVEPEVLGYRKSIRKATVNPQGYFFTILENEATGHKVPFFVRFEEIPTADAKLKALYTLHKSQKAKRKTELDAIDKKRLTYGDRIDLADLGRDYKYNMDRSLLPSELKGMFYIPASPKHLDVLDFQHGIYQVFSRYPDDFDPTSETWATTTNLQREKKLDDAHKPWNQFPGWRGFKYSPRMNIINEFTNFIAEKCYWFNDHMLSNEYVDYYTIQPATQDQELSASIRLHWNRKYQKLKNNFFDTVLYCLL